MEIVIVVGILGCVLFAAWPKQSGDRNRGRRQDKTATRPSFGKTALRRRGSVYRPNPLYDQASRKRVESAERKKSRPAFRIDMTLSGCAYITDWDTISIRGTKIRLAGIEAPELDMPWGQKSKWAMVAICKGQIVTAELDGERSFDRLVATCYLPNGRDIGAELVKQGLALDLPVFSRGKYRKFEPEGARRRLANGKFGHASLKMQRTGQH